METKIDKNIVRALIRGVDKSEKYGIILQGHFGILVHCLSLGTFTMFPDISCSIHCLWARGSVGRAPRSQRGGRGFDPLRVHQKRQVSA